MNLGGRVAERLSHLGWEQKDLLAAIKRNGGELGQQNLSALIKRDSKKSDAAFWIAEALGVSVRWLVTGQGHPDDVEWPFRRVARSRWDACDDNDKGYVEQAMNKALAECEEALAERSPRETAAARRMSGNVYTLPEGLRQRRVSIRNRPRAFVVSIHGEWGLF